MTFFALLSVSVAFLLSNLFILVNSQLASCLKESDCVRAGESCNTILSSTALKLCEGTAGFPCFCSPINPSKFVTCFTLADCPEPEVQRCGKPFDMLTDNICVGCDSIPVIVTAANQGNCKVPSESPSPSTMSSQSAAESNIPEPSPPTLTDPEVSSVPRDPVVAIPPLSSPDGVFDSSISPVVTPSVSVVTTVSEPVDEGVLGDDDGDVSGSVSPIPEEPTDALDEDDPVCVDAVALMKHLTIDDLVFEKHRRAAVLCDANGNCATPGHMIHFEGRAMMMKSYCELDSSSCSRTVKLVNSPKFRRGLKIPSHTDGFSFTTFAARYETRAEEHVLKTLIHAGL